MKKISLMFTGVMLMTATTALAAGNKTYQVTGPVLELRNDAVVVQKGTEKWEIAKDKDTKLKGDLKAGSKATITYTMKAVSIDVKDTAKKK